ncbi:PIR protein, putative [Plasmodium sp. gorilla clade G1]|nr:PIR protein, putative [Plasmodium sp. gorilla clade G1]
MKVHYFNILLIALPLNILVSSPQKNPSITQKIPTTRLLCECELYAPANYDNDPQMKSIMENFNKQIRQRFHEYDECMKTTRQKCKDQCDKEIQKIILKDKLEKELTENFATLQTDIQSDSIPTCVCEKSIADKVEKGCLKCAQNLGGIGAPSSGVLGEIAAFALKGWKTEAIKAAITAAEKAGAAQGAIAGKARGMEIVIRALTEKGIAEYCPEIFESIQKIERFTELKTFSSAIIKKNDEFCSILSTSDNHLCAKFGVRLGTFNAIDDSYGTPAGELVPKLLEQVANKADLTAKEVAKNIGKDVAASITKEKTSEIAATYASWETTIIAAVVAIVVIVLVMIIIYLILRYRRKKKMKKKLQYIKLLEE